MKKIKYLLFLIPFLFTLNVYANEYNISSKIKYNVSLPGGSYGADDINDGYNSIMGRYSVGTRYNGRIGYMEFFVDGSDFNASTNHTYTITLNMATNDWRNNFMGPIVSKCNSDGSVQTTNYHLVVSNFRFISRKQIKFNFKTNSTLSPYYKFVLYSNNYASHGGTAITGETNWNLSSIIISDNISSGGGSSGGGSSGGSSSSNQDIINNQTNNTNNIISNNNQNTTDIIDNNNQNTQDIIDNQNKNQEQTNQLLGQCFTNIYNISHIDNLYNFLNNNGVFTQKDPDSNNYSKNLKLQFFNDNSLVSQSSYTPVLSVGRFKFDFTKNSTFNNIRFGVNGSEIDTLIAYDVSYLKDNHNYSLIFDITNAENGSVTLEKIMITDKVTYLLPYMSYNETTCNSKLDTVGQSVLDGAQSIIGNNNQNTQSIINGVNAGANAITDKVNEQIESQKVCELIDKNKIGIANKELSSKGEEIVSLINIITPYIKINENTKITQIVANSSTSSTNFCFYNINKSIIKCINARLHGIGDIQIPTNSSYIRFTIRKDINEPQFKLCSPGNQVINDNLNDIKDSLTDETTPEIDLDLDLDSSSPVSDLLTMPLTILNKVFNITDDTCEPYVLPFDFSGGNNTLTFPCIDLKTYLGNTVYNVLDTILCFYLCYQIGMMCISIYEDITSLRDGFDGLYTPKHHDTSTRVGRGELEGKY